MSLFLITFFLLYGGIHFYALRKMKYVIHGGGPVVLLLVFMAVMIAAPLLVRIAERQGYEGLACFLAYTGYTWMGFLFLFVSGAFTLDIYHGILSVVGKATGRDTVSLMLLPPTSLFIPVTFACFASIYGAYEAWDIRTEHVDIRTSKLPPGLDRLRIVQISDVHLGLIVREVRFRRIMEQIRDAKPDVLVSTGDFVDGQIDGLASISKMLGEIQPRFGKYAVTGNHEFYAGLGQSLKIMEHAGFRVLRGEGMVIAEGVTIAGVDDPAVHRGDRSVVQSEETVLLKLPRDAFIVLLKHRPAVSPQSLGLFDLQLSGHVHKGQIFPFNLLTHLFYPVKMGLSHYPQNSALYVSRGSGTWGPPIRVGAPPEVTVIDVLRP